MKKTVSTILIVIMLFCVGCTAAHNEEVVPEWETDNDGSTDMNGLTFQFASPWTVEYCPELGYSTTGDKIIARYAEAEKALNINIIVSKTEDSSATVMRDVAAGMPTYDLWDAHSPNAISLYKSGYIFPLNEISTIDLSQEYKYAPERFRRYGIYKGNSYGFFSWAWEIPPQYEGVILFNNELVLKYGFQNPYEMQESGEWNWSNFKSYLEKINSVAADDNIIPMVNNDYSRISRTAIFSNGGSIVEEKNGIYKSGLSSEKVMKALEFLCDLRENDLMTTGGNAEFAVQARAVFMSCESYFGTLHGESYDDYPSVCLNDYGMMPFPYGPSADASTVSAYVFHGRRLLWVLSFSENDPEEIGTVIDYLFEPLDGDSKEYPGWKAYLERMAFHHQEGFDNFEYMIDNVGYDYSVELESVYSQITSAFSSVVSGAKSATEAIDSIESAVQSCIDENMNDK